VEAARGLRDMEAHRQHIFTRPVTAEEKSNVPEPELDLSLYQLMRAFQSVISQFEGAPVREVELETFTIEEKIDVVRGAIGAREPVLFTDLFAGSKSRIELIVTLMAMLELLKHGQARVEQESSFGPIWIYRGQNFGRPMGEIDWTAEPGAPAEVALTAESSSFDDADLAMHAPLDTDLNDESPLSGGTVDEDGESEPR
jgi:chromatin segregation and condensation protein Rec8/ScpA/Scc1 (kleisin family)